MDLVVDAATSTAVATLTLEAVRPGWLAADGLDVRSVTGAAVIHQDERRLWLDPAGPSVTIAYAYHARTDDGWLSGSTRTWPDRCGRIFPCDPAPADGLTWTLDVHPAAGNVAVAPDVAFEGPPYMVAWATGPYRELALGRSDGGVALSVAYLPDHEASARAGAVGLVRGFSFFERTLGPYPFGAAAGPVEVVWPDGAYGGMEHHPRWHVPTGSLADPEANLHEAAHGWFGDGVRLRCWEDFVLSEGTATWLALRARVELGEDEAALWDAERAALAAARAGGDTTVAWPKGCSNRPPTPLSEVPYSGGALFLRAVEGRVGRPALDASLRRFVADYLGKPAGMADLVARVEADTGTDLTREVAMLRDPTLGSPPPR